MSGSLSFTFQHPGLASGTHNITVTDNAGTSGAATVAVSVTPTPTPTPTVGIPAQAVAAGYVNPVVMSEFNSAGEIVAKESAIATTWYTGGPDNGGSVTAPGDYSVANSILSINKSGPSASNIFSARTTSARTSRPGARLAPDVNGLMFQYYYVEAKIRFNNTRGGTGWPAWWATMLNSAVGDHLETDFFECAGTPMRGNINCGFLDWFDGVNDPGVFGEYMGALFADGTPTDWGAQADRAGLDTNGDWNVYGCLWTPTEISYWWTSWARRLAGTADTLITRYPTDRPIGGAVSNNNARRISKSIGDAANNGNGQYLMLGAGDGSGFQVDWVHLWQ